MRFLSTNSTLCFRDMMKLFLLLSALCVVGYGRVGFGPGEQEWDHVEVRPGANMFWWLYYTTANVKNHTERPLIIWLQGGPGASSTGYGNFAELGPLDIYQKARNFSWVHDANVLFIDNPVGTGFSYTKGNKLLATTNMQIAEDLLELMRGFYNKCPEFKSVPLYITAESYGGKMVVDFALLLDEAIKSGIIKSNLIGVGLGDSWISPVDSVLTWAPYLLQVGAIDRDGYAIIQAAAEDTKQLIDYGYFYEATNSWGRTERLVMQQSDNVDFYNVLKKIPSYGKIAGKSTLFKPSSRDADQDLDRLMNGPVKKALGLNLEWGMQNSAVFNALYEDFMVPVTDRVELLLNTTDIKVFVFSGQLDLIVDTPGTVDWVDRLRWPHSINYKIATRRAISVNGYNEGYVKEAGNFALYWVNRAGHMVPADNPAAMDFILRDLTDNYTGLKQKN